MRLESYEPLSRRTSIQPLARQSNTRGRIGRNALCLCGVWKNRKFKDCCGKTAVKDENPENRCHCGCACEDLLGSNPKTNFCLRCRQGHHRVCSSCGRLGSPTQPIRETYTRITNPNVPGFGEIVTSFICCPDAGARDCLPLPYVPRQSGVIYDKRRFSFAPLATHTRGGVPPPKDPDAI